MKNRKVLFLIVGLLCITAVLAVVYGLSAGSVAEGFISVTEKGEERLLSASDLPLHTVEGIQKDGKGQERRISGSGIELSALTAQSFSSVTVRAEDGYSAHFDADETKRAFLLASEDGSFSLAIFSDADSKRSVRNVKYVEFE